ncbi:MAG: PilZ domain-containing protein [Spirochaetaceae bacterium]|jgi:c-di-GMP-binding flagellar brake protein YcgR|nr:PilZ domain-containing protein [Spirochaetaceae bacterium]
MSVIIALIIASGIGAAFFIIKRNKTGGGVSWVQFYTKGKEAGFSDTDIKLLKELAQHSGIEHPAALFWSQVQIDECIKKFIQEIKQNQTEFLPENQEFLAKLYDFRKKMEMDRPIYKNGISSSRNIDELQTVQVVALNVGAFKSKIIINRTDYISIERPDSLDIPQNFSWKGKHLLLYFWRKNDAGYCFETNVIDEINANNPPLLKLDHSDKLLRTQSRKSLRVKTHRIAMLYRVEDKPSTTKPEIMPGIKCYLEDISDSGCALMAGGTASAGLRIIVQFVIDNTALSISGIVRNVEYDEKKNTSLLHIESDLIPVSVKNKIFSVMFGMVSDNADVVPLGSGSKTTRQAIPEPPGSTVKSEPVRSGANNISDEHQNKFEKYDDSHDLDFFNWETQSGSEDGEK